MRSGGILALFLALGWSAGASGDDFAAIEGALLGNLASGSGAREASAITFNGIAALPKVLGDSEHAFVIVRTDKGNAAKLLVSIALRRPSKPGDPVPLVMIERLETFEIPGVKTRLAQARSLALFDGFQIDLDTGAIVPGGFGGDLIFEAGGAGLKAINGAKLFTLEKPPILPKAAAGKVSAGRKVELGDFAGRFRLYANAQWSGVVDWKVDDQKNLTGEFRSDRNGQAYKVLGKVGEGAPHKLRFAIEFPRSRQDYEGWLWTNGKSGFSGSMTFLDQTFGFVALREGETLAPIKTDE